MIKTSRDRVASARKAIFQRETDEKKKEKDSKKGEGERTKVEGGRGKADAPPRRGTLTRKIPAVVEQFYLQWLNEILKNVSGGPVNRAAESIVP